MFHHHIVSIDFANITNLKTGSEILNGISTILLMFFLLDIQCFQWKFLPYKFGEARCVRKSGLIEIIRIAIRICHGKFRIDYFRGKVSQSFSETDVSTLQKLF